MARLSGSLAQLAFCQPRVFLLTTPLEPRGSSWACWSQASYFFGLFDFQTGQFGASSQHRTTHDDGASVILSRSSRDAPTDRTRPHKVLQACKGAWQHNGSLIRVHLKPNAHTSRLARDIHDRHGAHQWGAFRCRSLLFHRALQGPRSMRFLATLQRCARRCKARSGRVGAGQRRAKQSHVGAENS